MDKLIDGWWVGGYSRSGRYSECGCYYCYMPLIDSVSHDDGVEVWLEGSGGVNAALELDWREEGDGCDVVCSGKDMN